MSFVSIIFIALAMSMDAFVVAISKGASLRKPNFSQALRTGLIFGVIETITPIIGWVIGRAAVQYVAQWDHWIAFGLLLALGLHMIYEGVNTSESEAEEKPQSHSFWVLAVTAVATSIDALAIGVGLAFVEVNILVAAIAIGLATLSMVTIGVMLGRVIGVLAGKKAEVVGGLVLIMVGGSILYDHLA